MSIKITLGSAVFKDTLFMSTELGGEIVHSKYEKLSISQFSYEKWTVSNYSYLSWTLHQKINNPQKKKKVSLESLHIAELCCIIVFLFKMSAI